MNPLYRFPSRSSNRVDPFQLLTRLFFSTRPSWSSTVSSPKPFPTPPSPPPQPPFTCSIDPPSAEQGEPKASEKVFNRPRPREIPFQKKVENTVNLIGTVEFPVIFRTLPDGKSWAGTIISQNQPASSSPLRIPIIFQGDGAYTAAYHLKEKDLIYVAGELTDAPLPVNLDDNFGFRQVMVHDIHFVSQAPAPAPERRGWRPKQELNVAKSHDSKEKAFKSAPGPMRCWFELVTNPKQWCDHRNDKANGLVNPNYPDFKRVEDEVGLWLNSVPKWILPKLEGLEFSIPAPKPKKAGHALAYTFNGGIGGPSSSRIQSRKKDLLENPDKSWDNKSNKVGDFRHKDTDERPWLESAPEWVLQNFPSLKTKASFYGEKKQTSQS